MPGRLLPPSFYARECLEVACDLIGMELHHGPVALRITEVEAYRFPFDTASHCRMGRTERNAPMWGPPGRAYVYLCYGLHQMLNIVTNAEGEGAAVLVRACEPVAGLDVVQSRRGRARGPALLTGPGRVGAALAVDTSFSHAPLHERGGLELRRGTAPRSLRVGARVGVDFALPIHRDAPWRVADGESRWVSQPSLLRALDGDVATFLARQAQLVRAPMC